MLDKRGAILDVAREVSSLIRAHGLNACVIGGVAVVLHGHLRTTKDVDVYSLDPLERVRDVLLAAGFAFDEARREFERDGVAVQLVDARVTPPPESMVDVEDVRVASLGDVITMKLRSGSTSVLRAQDIADVIGLIRHRRLPKTFAGQVGKDVRKEFRRLVDAVERG